MIDPEQSAFSDSFDLICIGGGAAGFFAAISTAELSQKPLKIAILEATGRVLTKVKISGGGRCNVTNQCELPKELIRNYPRGGKNLLNSFFSFGPREMKQWLHEKGVPLHTEKDGRVFPKSNTSTAIVDCFVNLCSQYDIQILKNRIVKSLSPVNNGFEITTSKHCYKTSHVVLSTGSMLQGHSLARSLGHSITSLAPSLFTLKSDEPIVDGLAGTSVDNAHIVLKTQSKTYKQTGPLLITHWGFSGPAILKLSAFAAVDFLESHYAGSMTVNWAPNTSFTDFDKMARDLKKQASMKKIANTKLLPIPKKLWTRICSLLHLEDVAWRDVSDKSLRQLAEHTLRARYRFNGKGEFKEEFVTCGGVPLSEINVSTFESRIAEGLYLCGEILNVDGITGGFNFQNAWSSARNAAINIVGNTRPSS